MKVIQLTQGFVAWVDDEDYERLAQHKWCIARRDRRIYAVRNRHENNGAIYMHRDILGAPTGTQVDHRKHREDQMVVDNRKQNLRLAPGHSNKQSTRKRRGYYHSCFKAVFKDPKAKVRPWRAQITCDGNKRALGTFWCEGYAALVYDIEAVKAFGEFVLANFPVPGSTNWIFGPEEFQC